jgi:hypothetical protein
LDGKRKDFRLVVADPNDPDKKMAHPGNIIYIFLNSQLTRVVIRTNFGILSSKFVELNSIFRLLPVKFIRF